MTDLLNLQLSDNQLTGPLVLAANNAGGTTSLASLNVRNNRLSGPLPKDLAVSMMLRYSHFGVIYGNISIISISSLSQSILGSASDSSGVLLSPLTTLLASHITIILISTLVNIKHCSADFSDNSFSGSLPIEWSNNPCCSRTATMAFFSVRNNSLAGEIPALYSKWVDGTFFDFSYVLILIMLID